MTIKGLAYNTTYTLRARANDGMGRGKLSSPVSASTQIAGMLLDIFARVLVTIVTLAAKPPRVNIQEGSELKVAPKTPFSLSCNVTRADPIPHVQWESR